MTVQEFVDEYMKKANPEKFVQEHMVTKYISILQKQAVCSNIIEASSYETVEGNKIFQRNSVLEYMLYMMALCQLYTDIVFSDDSKMNDFILLDECGAIDQIYISIPGIERDKFDTIMKLCKEDFVSNERSIISYIDHAMTALSLLNDNTNNM